jgi:hypothetical protein
LWAIAPACVAPEPPEGIWLLMSVGGMFAPRVACEGSAGTAMLIFATPVGELAVTLGTLWAGAL